VRQIWRRSALLDVKMRTMRRIWAYCSELRVSDNAHYVSYGRLGVMGVARCPCLSGLPYAECCEPLHRGDAHAPTAERLMRSRFSAFAVGDTDYLLHSWHPSTRPARLELDPELRWYRLDIIDRVAGGPLDTRGEVEFEAHYRSPDGGGSQREHSTFVREGGRWLYLAAITTMQA